MNDLPHSNAHRKAHTQMLPKQSREKPDLWPWPAFATGHFDPTSVSFCEAITASSCQSDIQLPRVMLLMLLFFTQAATNKDLRRASSLKDTNQQCPGRGRPHTLTGSCSYSGYGVCFYGQHSFRQLYHLMPDNLNNTALDQRHPLETKDVSQWGHDHREI